MPFFRQAKTRHDSFLLYLKIFISRLNYENILKVYLFVCLGFFFLLLKADKIYFYFPIYFVQFDNNLWLFNLIKN